MNSISRPATDPGDLGGHERLPELKAFLEHFRGLVAAGRFAEAGELTFDGAVELPPPPNLPVDADALMENYEDLCVEPACREQEGWVPSAIENYKYRLRLDKEHLLAFRRSTASGGTQNTPDAPGALSRADHLEFYPDRTAEEIEEGVGYAVKARASFKLRLLQLAVRGPFPNRAIQAMRLFDTLARDDDRFGARLFPHPTLGPVSAKSLQTAYYASRVLTYIPETAIIIEIGGGFGALASRIMRARPKAVYLSSDLPINMILTEAYLRSMFGDACKPAYNVHNDLPEGARSVVMPPWKFFRLKGRATIVLNTMSFQHMDARNHAFYGEVMNHVEARLLYFVNRQDVTWKGASATIPARNYSFLDQFRVLEDYPFDERWVEILARRNSMN